ncbi:hypothetical protein AXG93_2145s1040 [Marchantia polymorpha subsp. ruderalis]|uniref:Uncharacterized protein n=1 Tax=Marchantia polymorpha subsp. ruderalis TaxID=1480154 RepID=A0A176W028_MARPO|nr:hypothetical protein AXG93_2145s1040 [Marchantia polymorpha subsp. ruderalis]
MVLSRWHPYVLFVQLVPWFSRAELLEYVAYLNLPELALRKAIRFQHVIRNLSTLSKEDHRPELRELVPNVRPSAATDATAGSEWNVLSSTTYSRNHQISPLTSSTVIQTAPFRTDIPKCVTIVSPGEEKWIASIQLQSAGANARGARSGAGKGLSDQTLQPVKRTLLHIELRVQAHKFLNRDRSCTCCATESQKSALARSSSTSPPRTRSPSGHGVGPRGHRGPGGEQQKPA